MSEASVETYLRDGCGRCEKFRTPECKLHRWRPALEALRELVLASGLVEDVKWGSPCYTLDGKNVIMLAAFKDSCSLQFFRGADLVDEEGVLTSPGPSSRFVRRLEFRSESEVVARRSQIERFVAQAIALERAGTKVAKKPAEEPMPVELERRLAADPALKKAFDALTPGRKRSHILYVSGAKQVETRERRAEKCAPVIARGRGFDER